MSKRKLSVTHVTGEVSTRSTEADYTHVVECAEPRAEAIATVKATIERLEAHEGDMYRSHLKGYRKRLAYLEAFDAELHWWAWSWHSRRDLAEKAVGGVHNASGRIKTIRVAEVDR